MKKAERVQSENACLAAVFKDLYRLRHDPEAALSAKAEVTIAICLGRMRAVLEKGPSAGILQDLPPGPRHGRARKAPEGSRIEMRRGS
jgi:hypothetical protein